QIRRAQSAVSSGSGDAASGELLRLLDCEGAVHRATFKRDGQRVITFRGDGQVRLWSAADGSLVRLFAAEAGAPPLSILDDEGSLLALALDAKTVRVWDLLSENFICAPLKHAD